MFVRIKERLETLLMCTLLSASQVLRLPARGQHLPRRIRLAAWGSVPREGDLCDQTKQAFIDLMNGQREDKTMCAPFMERHAPSY